MQLPIYVYGTEVLREETKEITQDYPGLQKLIEDMFETMHALDGVGLAAPQIGKAIRLFVVDADPLADDFPVARASCCIYQPCHHQCQRRDTCTMQEGCPQFAWLERKCGASQRGDGQVS